MLDDHVSHSLCGRLGYQDYTNVGSIKEGLHLLFKLLIGGFVVNYHVIGVAPGSPLADARKQEAGDGRLVCDDGYKKTF